MTRRSLFSALFAQLAVLPRTSAAKPRLQKFYLTGFLVEGSTIPDCDIPPIIAYGTNRLDALLNSASTVWTEKEYKDMRARIGKGFDQACAIPGFKHAHTPGAPKP